jgi:hypothetical protein
LWWQFSNKLATEVQETVSCSMSLAFNSIPHSFEMNVGKIPREKIPKEKISHLAEPEGKEGMTTLLVYGQLGRVGKRQSCLVITLLTILLTIFLSLSFLYSSIIQQ